MKAQELRIGNYVKAKYEDEAPDDYVDVICEIDGIDGCGFSEHMYWLHPIEGESREEYYEVEPIPLTEQWLIDFGFELDKDLFVGPCYCIRGDNYFFSIHKESMLFGHPQFNAKLEYVHQLQNLFYSLTGKELNKQ